MAPSKDKSRKSIRNLVVVLGDQLSRELKPFEDFDEEQDSVWMAETQVEATHVWTHKQRIALFLSAMRHFRDALEKSGIHVHYTETDEDSEDSLGALLEEFLKGHDVERVSLTKPGEHRVESELREACRKAKTKLDVLEDTSFFCSLERFDEWAEGRKQLRMEYFYREMRKEFEILMDGDDPEGGKWNYDSSNRSSFGKDGPEGAPAAIRFKPDKTTEKVLDWVGSHYADHPGELDTFGWPVTAEDAKKALKDFVSKGLAEFGKYQDAMWKGEPFLNHSLLAAAMNLKLLMPRDVVAAVEKAYEEGHVPIESAEGYIRQVLGWREYVRGVYWRHMPDYVDRNEMGAKEPLPEFYWSGETSMNCMRECVSQTLKYGYAHHIQRLMVTGLFGLLWGVDPSKLHQWYLAVYVDAVEWVELPNTLGMSQYADGGVMASKPYVATGKYLNRMSNYCSGCTYDPNAKEGENACPFTVLYWEYLLKHEEKLDSNPRMALQLRNARRLDSDERKKVRKNAKAVRERLENELEKSK